MKLSSGDLLLVCLDSHGAAIDTVEADMIARVFKETFPGVRVLVTPWELKVQVLHTEYDVDGAIEGLTCIADDLADRTSPD